MIEAAANGASVAIKICSNIAANLIAFLAFIKFVDTMVSWFFGNVDLPHVTFEWLLGKAFIPIAAIMGVEWKDCEKVSSNTVARAFIHAYFVVDGKRAHGLLGFRMPNAHYRSHRRTKNVVGAHVAF